MSRGETPVDGGHENKPEYDVEGNEFHIQLFMLAEKEKEGYPATSLHRT